MRIVGIGLAATLAVAALSSALLTAEAAQKAKPGSRGHDLGSWAKVDGLDVSGQKKQKHLRAKAKPSKRR